MTAKKKASKVTRPCQSCRKQVEEADGYTTDAEGNEYHNDCYSLEADVTHNEDS